MPTLTGIHTDNRRLEKRITAATAKVAIQDVRSIDLSEFPKAAKCRELVLNPVKTIDVGPLAGHPALESIQLTLPGRPDLSPLARCPQLRELELNYVGSEPVDLSTVGIGPQLTKLTISSKMGRLDLTPLAQAQTITKLDLSAATVLDLAPVRRMSGVRTLTLQGTAPRYDLAPLAGMPLEHFFLSANGWKEVDLTPIAVPTLQQLAIIPLDVTTLNLDPLAACTSLQVVSLAPGYASILRLTGLAGLANLHTIRFPSYVDLVCHADPKSIACVPLREHLRHPRSGI
ncbi:MAG: hypothetical protein U0271_09745 [Polyangiaceae bacterium]